MFYTAMKSQHRMALSPKQGSLRCGASLVLYSVQLRELDLLFRGAHLGLNSGAIFRVVDFHVLVLSAGVDEDVAAGGQLEAGAGRAVLAGEWASAAGIPAVKRPKTASSLMFGGFGPSQRSRQAVDVIGKVIIKMSRHIRFPSTSQSGAFPVKIPQN